MGKIVTVNLPDIGEGVVEGEVIEWLKSINDKVAQDEPVVIVMTDKATVELPAPCPGVVVKQYFRVGEIAIRDKPLYDIETTLAVSKTETSRKEGNAAVEQKKNALPKSPVKADTRPQQAAIQGKAQASPATRKLAKELNTDLNMITGTGPEGHVTREDVIKFHTNVKSSQESPQTAVLRLPDDQEKPLLGIRNLMAKRMAESKRMVPHFSYFEQVDATRLVQLRNSFKEEAAKQDITVTYMPFIIKALSLSLNKYPVINSSVDTLKNSLIIHQQHNVGLAITTKQGLIVPVLKNVQSMKMYDLILAYEDLKLRAFSGKLLASDMKDSTITVSNFGVLGGGGLWATPVINYPEVAILGIARIHKQPLVRNGAVVIRDTLNLSWSFDHRVIDGDLAAAFSHFFSTFLQNPAPLL